MRDWLRCMHFTSSSATWMPARAGGTRRLRPTFRIKAEGKHRTPGAGFEARRRSGTAWAYGLRERPGSGCLPRLLRVHNPPSPPCGLPWGHDGWSILFGGGRTWRGFGLAIAWPRAGEQLTDRVGLWRWSWGPPVHMTQEQVFTQGLALLGTPGLALSLPLGGASQTDVPHPALHHATPRHLPHPTATCPLGTEHPWVCT